MPFLFVAAVKLIVKLRATVVTNGISNVHFQNFAVLRECFKFRKNRAFYYIFVTSGKNNFSRFDCDNKHNINSREVKKFRGTASTTKRSAL